MEESLFDELNRLAKTQISPAGTLLFGRDQPSSRVFLVRKGAVALLWPDAEEVDPMEVAVPPSIIGLPAALNGTYSATAKCVTHSELGVISTPRVLELLEFNPALCRVAMRLMGQEIARMRSAITARCGNPPSVS